MRLTRAEVVALLQDVGIAPGKELEYQTISGSVEAVGCIYSEYLEENLESIRAWICLRESLFWARRSLGVNHALQKAGSEAVTDVTVDETWDAG